MQDLANNAAMPTEPYFYIEYDQLGSWWNRHYQMQVRFSADDFEQFNHYFQQVVAALDIWQNQYKKKAKVVEMEILAHPWITKRILSRLQTDFSADHPYGKFCAYGMLKIHIFDPFDKIGQNHLLYEQGKKLKIT